jgi:hypothetical protein
MLRIVTSVFIALATVCVSNLARAQDDLAPRDDFSRVGCYLGASGTVAFSMSGEDALEDAADALEDALEKETGLSANVSADVSESLGLHARAGCRAGWGGGELHFEWLQEFEVDVDVEVDGLEVGGKAKVDGWALTLDGKLYPLWLLEDKLPPLARRFQPFATVGFGYLTGTIHASADGFSGEGDDWDFAARFGGGLDVYVTRHIAISVDTTYVLPVSDALEGFDYLSVGWGVLFRF